MRSTPNSAAGRTASGFERALPLFDQAIGEMRGQLAGGHRYLFVGFTHALACRALILADLGRFDEARAGFEEALQTAQGSGHAVEASILSQ